MSRSLINKTAVRQFSLDTAASLRAHTFERVSDDFLNSIEAELRSRILAKIHSHPSKGKTLK